MTISIENLTKLADKLDAAGKTTEADSIGIILEKLAGESAIRKGLPPELEGLTIFDILSDLEKIQEALKSGTKLEPNEEAYKNMIIPWVSKLPEEVREKLIESYENKKSGMELTPEESAMLGLDTGAEGTKNPKEMSASELSSHLNSINEKGGENLTPQEQVVYDLTQKGKEGVTGIKEEPTYTDKKPKTDVVIDKDMIDYVADRLEKRFPDATKIRKNLKREMEVILGKKEKDIGLSYKEDLIESYMHSFKARDSYLLPEKEKMEKEVETISPMSEKIQEIWRETKEKGPRKMTPGEEEQWHEELLEERGGRPFLVETGDEFRRREREESKWKNLERFDEGDADMGNQPIELGDGDFESIASKKELFKKLSEVADRLDSMGAKKEADLVDGFIEKYSPSVPSELELLSKMADDFDSKGMKKEADAIDELIKIKAADVEWKDEADTEQSKRYDEKYHKSLLVREPKTKQERIDREGRDKHHAEPFESVASGALSTRYCPEHLGDMLGRVGENTYQCPRDGAVYNWEAGWTDHEGNQYPGGSISGQSPDSSGYSAPHRIWDSRESTLNRIN